MRKISTVAEMQIWSDEQRRAGRRVGFVPTMGALHPGHLSLMTRARMQADAVVVSIFVNPTQFGQGEDFNAYPRTLDADMNLLERHGVDVVFAPGTGEMYPAENQTAVLLDGLSGKLEGASRPTHFAGVTLIVTKLLHAVRPHVAVFGRKDAQQAIIVRRMVRDLNFGVVIDVAPTVREESGLAMSSRNAYLSDIERAQATILSRALRAGYSAWQEGERDRAILMALMKKTFSGEPSVALDYLEIVSQNDLEPVDVVGPGTLVAGAVRIGKTRLIDNWWIREDGVGEF
jgi:pantoate--beta-alanine ligase